MCVSVCVSVCPCVNERSLVMGWDAVSQCAHAACSLLQEPLRYCTVARVHETYFELQALTTYAPVCVCLSAGSLSACFSSRASRRCRATALHTTYGTKADSSWRWRYRAESASYSRVSADYSKQDTQITVQDTHTNTRAPVRAGLLVGGACLRLRAETAWACTGDAYRMLRVSCCVPCS